MTSSESTPLDTAAPAQPEVVFCNVCNQSIPEQAFLDGRAIRAPNGGCPAAGAGRPAGDTAAVTRLGALVLVVTVLLLGGLVAGFLHLDGRLNDVGQQASASLDSLVARAKSNGSSQERLEQAIGRLRESDRSAEIGANLAAVERRLVSLSASIPSRFDTIEVSSERTRQQLRTQEQFLGQLSSRLSTLRADVRAIAANVNELRAAPNPTPVAGPVGVGDGGRPEDPIAATGLPAELAHHAARLGDEDPATRYEAADQLLASGDERAFELVLPLAKDPDLFVRLLVLDGAATVRSNASVDALIIALGDPESLVRDRAIRGLQDLTGQTFPFDPDAPTSQRAAMQQRWQKWWEGAREDF